MRRLLRRIAATAGYDASLHGQKTAISGLPKLRVTLSFLDHLVIVVYLRLVVLATKSRSRAITVEGRGA